MFEHLVVGAKDDEAGRDGLALARQLRRGAVTRHGQTATGPRDPA
jgi:hypothetical protein